MNMNEKNNTNEEIVNRKVAVLRNIQKSIKIIMSAQCELRTSTSTNSSC